MRKYLVSLILLLSFISISEAATIHGNIYNFYLEKQENVIVSVNSTPKQVIVAKDGSYSFELDKGAYKIEASYIVNNETKSSASRIISIKSEKGDYVIDLILFPAFEEEAMMLEETEQINIEDEYFVRKRNYLNITILILAIAGFCFVILLILKYKKLLQKLSKEIEKTELDEEHKELIKFIKECGGRTTQKDIRKRFLSSEAKISLLLSEMEDKGIIKKIKKGRGNIIILKK